MTDEDREYWNEYWHKIEKQEYEFLDSKDLLPYIDKEKDIYDIICDIENAFEDEYLSEHENDECLFNMISSDEFADYICKRYNFKLREEIKLFFC